MKVWLTGDVHDTGVPVKQHNTSVHGHEGTHRQRVFDKTATAAWKGLIEFKWIDEVCLTGFKHEK